MKLNPQDLETITHLTLQHYNQRVEHFWEAPMRVIALIEDPRVIRRILEHLGLWAPQVAARFRDLAAVPHSAADLSPSSRHRLSPLPCSRQSIPIEV